MTADEYKGFDPLFSADICETVKGRNCADARTSYGGASLKSVKQNLKSIKERVKKYN
jgi:argininosuccinate lyase